MFHLLIILGAVIFMYRAAEIENRSGVIWAILTLVLCLVLGGLIGFVASFMIMFVSKLLRKR